MNEPEFLARQDAAFATVRTALDGPVEVSTAGELAAVLARVPASTPVLVDPRQRADPSLGEDVETYTATVLRVVTLADPDNLVEIVDEAGVTRPVAMMIPAVEIGVVDIADGQPIPPHPAPTAAADRAEEALYSGDADVVLTALGEQLAGIAAILQGADAGMLHTWISDPDLCAQLDLEGQRLLHTTARLLTLAHKIAEHQQR